MTGWEMYMVTQAILIGGTIAKKAIDWLRGKGPSPFGEDPTIKTQQTDLPEEAKFKARIQPRLQQLLEQRIGDLSQTPQNASQSMMDSPLASIYPQLMTALSGDPRSNLNNSVIGDLYKNLEQEKMNQPTQQLPEIPNQEQSPQPNTGTGRKLNDSELYEYYQKLLKAPGISDAQKAQIQEVMDLPPTYSGAYPSFYGDDNDSRDNWR